ncbi:CHAT domain-containing protein [bacterium]|nr:CHAT domain-containing protein [bacterium]
MTFTLQMKDNPPLAWVRFKSKRIILLGFLLIFWGSAQLRAEGELLEIVQKTTHPADDIHPALSPDGHWLAYASDRSGNMDIWAYELATGRTVQLTHHAAEDIQPVWSPDSRQLVFVSKRRDALGDIWLLNLDLRRENPVRGDPVQITDYLGLDRDPCFSPDGKAVVFTSDQDGLSNLWIADVRSRMASRLTSMGGSEPTWSPKGSWIAFTSSRHRPDGDLFLIREDTPEMEDSEDLAVPLVEDSTFAGQADWSPDGTALVFRRICSDTDGDGIITPLDRSNLSQIFFNPSDPLSPGSLIIPLTNSAHPEQDPFWASDSLILFASRKGSGLDIWAMPADGLFPRAPSADEQYYQVFSRFGSAVSVEALRHAIIGYQRVLLFFPGDSLLCARALLRMGEIHQILEDNLSARGMYGRIVRDFPDLTGESAQADLRLAALKDRPLDDRIRQCREVIRKYPMERSILAESWIMLGDLYREKGDYGQSLSSYTQVLSDAKSRNWRAQAQMRLGGLFTVMGQEITAKQAYFAVLREYDDVPLWRKRAADQLMNQVQGDDSEKIRGYRRLIQDAGDFPALMAEAQLSIADILFRQGDYERARIELEGMEDLVPNLPWALAKAKIFLAKIHAASGDALKGIFLLREVIDTYKGIEGGIYRIEAGETLFELYFDSAERLRRQGDYALAASRYQEAMRLHPDDIWVHWGLSESMYRAGKIESLLDSCRARLNTDPRNPVSLFAMGLALSYQAEKNKSTDVFNQSNAYLMQSLEADYRMILPYRALSYNYEFMERLEEEREARQDPALVRIGKTIVSPVQWAIGLLPFVRERVREKYYERAIGVLITALEINDEKADPAMEASLAQNLANNFYNTGEFGFRKAFLYYEKRLSLDTTFTNPLVRAVFYEQAGHCGLVQEESERSEIYLKKAIQAYDALDRRPAVLRNQKRLALLYHLAGRYEDALSVYEEAARQDERNAAWENLEMGYRNIAYNYHLMGEPADALKYAKKAEKILLNEKIDAGPPEKSYLRIELLGFSIPVWGMEEIGAASAEGLTKAEEAALIYGLKSKSYESLRETRPAIEEEKKRREIFRKRKDRLAERISLLRIGVLHFQAGEYDAAWDAFLEVWLNSEKKNDLEGYWTSALNLSSVALVELSQYGNDIHARSALDCLNRTLERIEEEPSPSRAMIRALVSASGTLRLLLMQSGTATASAGQDSIRIILNRFEQLSGIESQFQDALDLSRKDNSWKDEAVLIKNLADLDEQAGDIASAYARLEQSEALLRTHGDESLLWRILYAKARLASRLHSAGGKTLHAGDMYDQAISFLENARVPEERSEEWMSDRTDRWDLYVDAVRQAIDDGDVRRSLEILEKGREKQVADRVSRRPPLWKMERHKIIWGNLRYLKTRLEEIREKILEEESGKGRLFLIEQWGAEKARFEKEYQELLNQVQTEDPVLSYLSGVEPVDLGAVQRILPEGSAALCYEDIGGRIVLWAMDGDTVFLKELPGTSASVSVLAESFIQAVRTDSLVQEKGFELYSALLRPVRAFLDQKTQLVIIPGEAAWDVPFQALWDGEVYLADIWTLSYAPSLTAYRLAWGRRKINQKSVFFAGDIRDETVGEAIGRSFQNMQMLTGRQATESGVKDRAAAADVIHFERWIMANESNPWAASIVLFEDPEQDGFLRAEEAVSWNLKASFLALPAPLASKSGVAESVQMFYHALLYAGAPSIGVWRWQVDEAVRALFFDVFYRLLKSETAADAAGQAAWELRQTRPAVRDWGAFMVLGFPGMNTDERVQFARNNLVETVLIGRAFEADAAFDDAVRNYEKALNMAETLGDSVSIQRIEREIIRASQQGRLWAKAIEHQERLMGRTGRAGGQEARRNRQALIHFYLNNGQYDLAIENKKKAIAEERTGGPSQALAAALEELAFMHAGARQYGLAAAWTDSARQIYSALGLEAGEAGSLIRKGRFLLEQERYWEARDVLTEGLGLLEALVRTHGGDANAVFNLASGYQLLGIAYDRLAQYESAAQAQEKGLAYFMELDRPLQAAQGHQYMADLYWKSGDYRKALSHQQTALAFFESENDEQRLALAKSTLGLIQMSLGNLQEAAKSEEQALKLAEKIGRRADQAAILKNIGLIALQENRPAYAYEVFRRATEIDSSLGARRGLAYDYRNLGSLLILMGKPHQALPLLERGLQLSRQISDGRNAVQCRLETGKAYHSLGAFKSALSALDTALAESQGLVIPDILWRIHRYKALTLAAARRDAEAFDAYGKAIDIVEAMRAELKAEALKQGFLDSKMDLYYDAIAHLVRMGRVADSFDFAERAKSRNFIDLLGNQGLSMPTAGRQALERENQLRKAIQEVQARSARGGEDSSFRPEEAKQWADSLNVLRADYDRLMVEIQTENPELASLIRVDPWKSDRIQALLPEDGGLIEYFTTPHSLYIWLMTRAGLIVEQVPIESGLLDEGVMRFRETIKADLAPEKEGRELYALLIKPVEDRLAGLRHLVIVPHGILHYLPFAALMDEQGNFIMDRFSLSVAPSATVLGYCMEKGENRSPGGKSLRVLALGNPDLGDEAMDLPFAGKEVESLTRVYDQVTQFFGAEANEGTLRREIAKNDLIHFACHAVFEPEAPLFSALLLSPEKENDGRLEVQEIFGLNLNCGLVTLSACETGLSRVTRGDELIGLTRGFIFAGAPSIITSLWKVDDLATAVMVKRFYRFLRSGLSRSEALRQAQIIVRDAVSRSPSAWAAFQMTGDFR